MSAVLDAFDQYRHDGVKRFVQSAVVIDNEAEFVERTAPTATSSPARRVSGSLLARPAEVGEKDADQGRSATAQGGQDVEPSHRLDAKALTDAWSDKEVICGLYRPEKGEDMVPRALRASMHADVVILDWFLESGSSVRAKEIAREILKADHAGNGRLRLLAVYTSQPGVTSIAQDILDAVEEAPELKNVLTREGAVLTGQNVRICVLSKPQATGSADVDKVEEGDLPQRLISEFAALSRGLLTSFALHSIAAVRLAAHHIATVFRQELDGAYLGHRCSLPQPDDARDFAVELLVGELRNVVAVDEEAAGRMTDTVLDAWVDGRATAGFQAKGKAVAIETIKTLLHGGADALGKSKEQFVDSAGSPTEGRIGSGNFGRPFFDTDATAWSGHLEFARLSSFKREAFGRTQLPADFQPTLTLGTVLKCVGPANDAEEAMYSGLTAPFYVCMQPRCDSVRLTASTGFPFQTATESKQPFNLVVKERDHASGTPLLMAGKLADVVVIKFTPNQHTGTVRAEPQKDVGFVFVDDNQRRFLWLGDLRNMKAQQEASSLAANVHRVGTDEFEWLRLASRKAEIDFRPKAD